MEIILHLGKSYEKITHNFSLGFLLSLVVLFYRLSFGSKDPIFQVTGPGIFMLE